MCVRERVSEFEIGGRERKRETGMSFFNICDQKSDEKKNLGNGKKLRNLEPIYLL